MVRSTTAHLHPKTLTKKRYDRHYPQTVLGRPHHRHRHIEPDVRTGTRRSPDRTHLPRRHLPLAPEAYPEMAIWGYGGQFPDPMIRARRGDCIVRRLMNRLP